MLKFNSILLYIMEKGGSETIQNDYIYIPISDCRSVVPTKKKCNSYCLKVTMAKKNGNKIQDPSRQTYITINDVTATVPHITAQCKEEFHNNSLILVSGNCLPIEDSEATRGTHLAVFFVIQKMSLVVLHITTQIRNLKISSFFSFY